MKIVRQRIRGALSLLMAAALAGGFWMLRGCGHGGEVAADSERTEPETSGPAPVAVPVDASREEPRNPIPRGVRELPPHSSFLVLTVNVSPGSARLVARAEHLGRCKPGRSLAGRVGVFYRALDSGGHTVLDGMLPDPFEIRVFRARPGTADVPLAAPVPPRESAEILLRLPVLPDLKAVELFHVPADAQPNEPRDNPEWRLGLIPL